MSPSIRTADLAPMAIGSPSTLLARGRAWLALCAARREERLALAQADLRLLRDIGIDRAVAAREVGKAPWEA